MLNCKNKQFVFRVTIPLAHNHTESDIVFTCWVWNQIKVLDLHSDHTC